MTFPRYSNYRDSSVDWLGPLPSTWEIKKFRYLFSESGEKIESSVVGPMLSVSGYRGVEIKEYSDDNQKRTDDDLVGYRIVHPGQLVVNTMWLNYSGLGVSEFTGHVSPAYRAYWIDDSLHKPFVHYLLRSNFYVLGYTKFLTGVRPNSLQMSREDLMNFPIVIPSTDEQRNISDFLANETSKIDSLISEQENLIKLLMEKRKAVISHAVTKGLNPNIKMKDSGIEWLCEVPEHWQVSRIKHTCYINDGNHGEEYPSEFDYTNELEGVPFIRAGNISQLSISSEDMLYISKEKNASMRKGRLQAGDVLFTNRGEIGKIAIVPSDFEGANLNSQIAYLRTNHDLLSEKFLAYTLQSEVVKNTIDSTSAGSVLTQFPIGDLKEIPIALPPMSEQISLVKQLDNELDHLEKLSTEAKRGIELLVERRSALISAAVTGQIDVRNVVGEMEAR